MASERGTHAEQRRSADSPASGGVTFLGLSLFGVGEWVGGVVVLVG